MMTRPFFHFSWIPWVFAPREVQVQQAMINLCSACWDWTASLSIITVRDFSVGCTQIIPKECFRCVSLPVLACSCHLLAGMGQVIKDFGLQACLFSCGMGDYSRCGLRSSQAGQGSAIWLIGDALS
ncbi:hypothetical protein D5S17_18575 [Pseudonocardiaceae bacterium YIM PH 21723]|nr:hypothetical protein D5S17_18575 [Pseudonocardiaceae bacterium YIM PH 21723]